MLFHLKVFCHLIYISEKTVYIVSYAVLNKGISYFYMQLQKRNYPRKKKFLLNLRSTHISVHLQMSIRPNKSWRPDSQYCRLSPNTALIQSHSIHKHADYTYTQKPPEGLIRAMIDMLLEKKSNGWGCLGGLLRGRSEKKLLHNRASDKKESKEGVGREYVKRIFQLSGG